jgi:immunity protein, SdpI family
MKYKKFVTREIINWLFILMPFIYIFLVYDKLPRFAPFSLDSEQTIYYQVLFVMGISIVGYIILLVKPTMVPATRSQEHLKSYNRIRSILLGFASLLSMIFISQKIGIAYNWSKIALILSMVYITVIGNLYPTLKHKYLIGIKNSWTQSNEIIWKRTHSFAGKIFFWGGLLGALYGILFDVNPVPYMPVIYIGYVFTLLLIPHIYSYLLFRKTHSSAHQ